MTAIKKRTHKHFLGYILLFTYCVAVKRRWLEIIEEILNGVVKLRSKQILYYNKILGENQAMISKVKTKMFQNSTKKFFLIKIKKLGL